MFYYLSNYDIPILLYYSRSILWILSLFLSLSPFPSLHYYLFHFDFKYFAYFLVDYFGSIFQAVDLIDSADEYSCSIFHFVLPAPEIPDFSNLILPSYLVFEELYFHHYLPGGVHRLDFLFSYICL